MNYYGTHIIFINCLFLISSQNYARRHVLQNNVIEEKADVLYRPLDVPCNVPVCDGPLAEIYCFGDILSSAWQFGLQQTCPGDRLKYSASIVLNNFRKLSYPMRRENFQKFCSENFEQNDYLKTAELNDWEVNPSFLTQISNGDRRQLASNLHKKWKLLAREFKYDVFKNSHLYPIWPVRNAFVVPGGRFDVYFYWDTYWILKGLLVSRMFDTAEGIINNFADLIAVHGFIPNSGNIQLSKRTQPPLFCHMVWDYAQATGKYNENWLEKMDREIAFWENNRTTLVKSKTMFIYKTLTDCPRPESFLGDYRVGINQTNPEKVWSSIAAACESGWDFSSRWMDQKTKELNTIHTPRIVPVDLNVFMAKNYEIIAHYYTHFGREDKAAENRQKLDELTSTLHTILWNEKDGVWYDFDLDTIQQNANFYPSNILPLLLQGSNKYASRIADYITKTGVLNFEGGIPTTLPVSSKEQWDFPNVWAPTQHLFIKSMLATNNSFLLKEAERQSTVFIKAVYNGMFNPPPGRVGTVFEKYDARSSGGFPGGGGEYLVQEGFGWTNGAVLDLIWLYRESTNPEIPNDGMFSSNLQKVLILSAWIFTALILVCFLLRVFSWKKTVHSVPEIESRGLLDDTEDV